MGQRMQCPIAVGDHECSRLAVPDEQAARRAAFGEGVSCLQQALTVYGHAGIGTYHSLSVPQLGEADLLTDQVENARTCADRAVMLARGRGERVL